MCDSTMLVFSLHTSKLGMSPFIARTMADTDPGAHNLPCLNIPVILLLDARPQATVLGRRIATFKRHAMIFVHSDATRCWFASVGKRFRRLTMDKTVTVSARDLHA